MCNQVQCVVVQIVYSSTADHELLHGDLNVNTQLPAHCTLISAISPGSYIQAHCFQKKDMSKRVLWIQGLLRMTMIVFVATS